MSIDAGKCMDEEKQRKILLRGRLNGRQLARLDRLLDMMYRPSELARELDLNPRQFYRAYIPLGCPHERDEKGRIWINGASFRDWARHVYINGASFRDWARHVYKKGSLGDNEAFCLTCKRPVPIEAPERRSKGNLTYLLSTCPFCGRRLTRIIELRRRSRD